MTPRTRRDEERHGSVELEVEELVLHGFPPADRHRIADALQRELTHLLTEQGPPPWMVPPAAGARPEGAVVEFAAGGPPEAIGTRIARAVYAGSGA